VQVESKWAIILCEFVTNLAEGGRFIHQKMMSHFISCVKLRWIGCISGEFILDVQEQRQIRDIVDDIELTKTKLYPRYEIL
jgi:hypothetical protein